MTERNLDEEEEDSDCFEERQEELKRNSSLNQES